ncbi:MAG: hypothetical protein J6S69_03445 [Proteobacteria bacterium]|nr:hypothetical protein [Pseudomonadota bacterium]
MRELFAELTEQTWKQVRPYWEIQKPGLLHEDNTFGSLKCYQMPELKFLLTYEEWHIQLTPDSAQIDITTSGKSNIDEQYLLERLAVPFLRLIRGAVLLHSGAIAVNDRIYAFLAPSGVGKTTLTTALLTSLPECRLVCDDILAFVPQSSDSGFLGLPSSSHLAMRHPCFDHQSFIKRTQNLGHKHLLFVQHDKCQNRAGKLEAITLLQTGQNFVPKSISMVQAIPSILNQQMIMHALPAEIRRYQFRTCMQLIQHCPAFHLQEVAPNAWQEICHQYITSVIQKDTHFPKTEIYQSRTDP